MTRTNINLSELPEATTNDGVKVYGTTSYETQIAILSHYLHTFDGKHYQTLLGWFENGKVSHVLL